MSSTLAFDLSGLGVSVRGAPPAVAGKLGRDWAAFRGASAQESFLDVKVEVGGRPMHDGTAMGRGLRSRLLPEAARFEIDEGDIEVEAGGRARARIAPGAEGRQTLGLVNLLCAAIGWRLPSRGGMILHAAAAVFERRAFLFVGPEGAGKTTWARLCESAGAAVLGDDVTLLDGGGGRIEALGSPFRAELAQAPAPGRWPVAAILLPAHGPELRIEPISRLALEARIAASALYVAAALESDSRIGAALTGIASRVPAWALTFARDTRFADLLRKL